MPPAEDAGSPPAPAPARLARLQAVELAGGLRLARANSFRSRLLGLAWMPPLAPEWGLLIPRCRSVHTFGMRFALDLVWLDGESRPLRLQSGVARRRTSGERRARAVVEVAAGRGEAFLEALSDSPPAPG